MANRNWDRRKPLFLLLALLAMVASGAAPLSAAEPTSSRARTAPVFTVYFENDVFGGTDRHYTNGTKLSWILDHVPGARGRGPGVQLFSAIHFTSVQGVPSRSDGVNCTACSSSRPPSWFSF